MAHTDPHGAGGHEPDVVGTKGIVIFLVSLAVAAGIVQVAMWGVFQLLKYDAKSEDRPLPANVARQLARLPPHPRLEDRPLAPRTKLNAEENARLNGYGWVDRNAGTVHIPIERAMDLIAQRGLPATAPAPAPGGSAALGAAGARKPLPPGGRR